MPGTTRGFVLIELMVVVFSIGVLVVVAIPAYTDYLKRARVSEAMLLSLTPKLAVADFYAHHGDFPADNRQAGLLEPEALGGQYVSAISVRNGVIEARFFHDEAEFGGKGLLRFKPISEPGFGRLYWECEAEMNSAYLPGTCRK